MTNESEPATKTTKKVLLLGGTGAMGTHLAPILARQGFKVDITSRRQRTNSNGIRHIVGDAHSVDFLLTIADDDHYDAIVDFMVYDTAQFSDTERLSILRNLADQYIFLSSARVFAQTDGSITEQSPRHLDVTADKQFLNSDIYPITKARQEDILRGSDLNWTIVRPYITFSECRIQLGVLEKEQWLLRAMNGQRVYFSEDIGQARTTLTYAEDVAHGIASLIGNAKAMQEDFNIATSETHTWHEIATLYDNILSRRVGTYKGMFRDRTNVMRDYGNAKWAIEYDRVLPRIFDNSKIMSVIPDLKFAPVYDRLAHCLDSFLDNPRFLESGPYTADAFFDRRTGEWNFSDKHNAKDTLKYILMRVIPFQILKVGSIN